MRPLIPLLLTAPLLLLAGCDGTPDNSSAQPGVVTNIMDQTLPDVGNMSPDNGITPVEAAPAVETPPAGTNTAGSIPAAMQGQWTGAAERCGDRSADLKLTVTPEQLLFHESVGVVKAVKADGDGRAVVEAAFTGEGQSWSRTLALRTSKDGQALTITNDGGAVTRKRC